MKGTRKLIGWILFAVVIAVLVYTSGDGQPHPEGYTGSYLGRSVADATTNQDSALINRAATQRF